MWPLSQGMGTALDRRDRRYPFRVSGVILARKGEVPVLSGDVSFRGAFLKTETPPQMRQLIRIRLVLPTDFEPGGKELVATGMVAHVVKPGDPKGRAAGAGIEFYGLDGELRARWERFIQFVHARASTPPEVSGKTADAGQGASRPGMQLDVQLYSGATEAPQGTSSASLAQDISRGRMFISTSMPLSVGAGLVINLIDPSSHVGFPIDCVVRGRDFGSKPGVEVEFLEMPLATWLALAEFLKPVALPESSPMVSERRPSRLPASLARAS